MLRRLVLLVVMGGIFAMPAIGFAEGMEMESVAEKEATKVDKDGNEGGFPVNPNGSVDSIAGLTDTTGRVLGLMPHPERFVRRAQHPHWSRLKTSVQPDGMIIFDNAVRFARENL